MVVAIPIADENLISRRPETTQVKDGNSRYPFAANCQPSSSTHIASLIETEPEREGKVSLSAVFISYETMKWYSLLAI